MVGFSSAERMAIGAVLAMTAGREIQFVEYKRNLAPAPDVLVMDSAFDGVTTALKILDPGNQRPALWIGQPIAAMFTFKPATVLPRPVEWKRIPQLLQSMVVQRLREVAPKPRVSETYALIIDDDLTAQTALASMLKPFGITSRFAPTGESGIATAAVHGQHLIFLDVTMPGMDGYTACRLLKSGRAARLDGKPPAVIMVTGRSGTLDKVRGKFAGCDAYLTKPVDPARLGEVVHELAPFLPNPDGTPRAPVPVGPITVPARA
jgi:two-component system, cell cycle response regulator